MLEEKTQDLMVNMQAVLPLIVANALNALGAIVILVIGLWLSGRADRLVARTLGQPPHFESFSGSLAR
jgi:small conductance mechanosensitive channel